MSSISHQMDNRPSVIGLRDRLLREARSERQRCLEVAEAAERRRAELRGISSVGIQTEPVFLMDGPRTDGTGVLSAASGPASWTQSDESAQAEALRTILLLGERGNSSRHAEGRLAQLEEELRAERAARQELGAQATHEAKGKEAAQQQVLCLEYELDGKEAALQVAERALERRDAELQQVQLQLQTEQEGLDEYGGGAASSNAAYEDARIRALRQQLMEREGQLDQKDQHIARLLVVLRQQRGSSNIDEYAGHNLSASVRGDHKHALNVTAPVSGYATPSERGYVPPTVYSRPVSGYATPAGYPSGYRMG